MKTCEECGLPIAACNALAMYRKAAEHYKRGRPDDAERCVESAEEFYERHLAILGELER